SVVEPWAVGVIRAAIVGGVAAALAACVGILLSPLTPIGVARTAEPHQGFAVDGVVVLLGGAGTFTAVLALGAAASWFAARARGDALGVVRTRGRHPSAVARLLVQTHLPPSATSGVRMAVEPGRGRTAVPVRSAVLGAAL